MSDQAERLRELIKLKKKATRELKLSPVAITSGKGGTGKTFIAINLAYLMSLFNKKTLLVDLDPNLSNINIILNEYPERSLYNYFNGEVKLNEIITQYNPGLDIIFGDSGKLEYPNSKSRNINKLLSDIEDLMGDYDFVVFDTSAGINDEILKILEFSRRIILVTNPEPTSVMDAYVVVKLLKNLTDCERVHTIINKARDVGEGYKAFENLNNAAKHFLKVGVDLLGILELDDAVLKSIMDQQVLVESNPECKTSRILKELSVKLIG